MNDEAKSIEDQSLLWNGAAGRAWVDAQALLDQLYRSFESLLVESITAESAAQVLDVGCGTGSTTLAAARCSSVTQCTGMDISAPMIAAARDRARQAHSRARFILGDAETYGFAPASFDMIISRFGVMFFADSIRAFANLRQAARSGALLRIIAWRTAAENPFMTAAERSAAQILPNMPTRRLDAPGQFAFADQHKIRHILQDSGWIGVDIQPLDIPCAFPEAELISYLTRFGPLGRFLDQVDEQLRTQVTQTVRAGFDPYVHGSEVRFVASCWSVSARSSESTDTTVGAHE